MIQSTQWDEITGDLNADIARYDPKDLPLLAHYTTLDSLEKMLTSDELWFSSPLLMNDHEEVRWGITQGVEAIKTAQLLKQNLGADRHEIFVQDFVARVQDYGRSHLFNTYVFCLSAHMGDGNDGRLSMWRGYGGNGTGAAIIFDLKKLNHVDASPMIVDRVTYGSTATRLQWASDFADKLGDIVWKHQPTDQELPRLSTIAFDRLKIAAIFSKHIGFGEEQEWRAVYMPERDRAGTYHPFYKYHNGPRGLEPKLKLDFSSEADWTASSVTFETIIDRIILGPSRASPLVEGTALRMLDNIGKSNLKSRVRRSDIPFRAAL